MNGASRIGGLLRRLLALAGLLVLVGAWSPWRAEAQEAPTSAPAAGESLVEEIGEAQAALEAGHADAAEQGAGMPQLDAGTYVSQLFWLVLTFGILFWLLSRKALPRVAEILEARQDRIAADLDRAAELRADAEAAERKHEQVVAEAQAKAQAQIKEVADRMTADAARRQAALDAELAQKLQEAEARIGAARDAAMAQLRDVAVESAQAATARVAGISVDRPAVEAALGRVIGEAA